jgi:hypothetical protein
MEPDRARKQFLALAQKKNTTVLPYRIKFFHDPQASKKKKTIELSQNKLHLKCIFFIILYLKKSSMSSTRQSDGRLPRNTRLLPLGMMYLGGEKKCLSQQYTCLKTVIDITG